MKKIIVDVKTCRTPKLDSIYMPGLGLFKRDASDIKNVYVNKEKGIVVTAFKDGSKKVAKCKKGDSFDLGVGIALCVAYKKYGGFNKYISKLQENGSIVDVATKAKAKAKK